MWHVLHAMLLLVLSLSKRSGSWVEPRKVFGLFVPIGDERAFLLSDSVGTPLMGVRLIKRVFIKRQRTPIRGVPTGTKGNMVCQWNLN